MPCTTLLAGKSITYDGSTMTARNEDSGSTGFCAKKFKVIHPEEQPRLYKTVLSHQEITLPNDPMRYTSMPNAVDDEGIWAAAGVNACNVSMTATETITSNDRVLSADPLTKTQTGKSHQRKNLIRQSPKLLSMKKKSARTTAASQRIPQKVSRLADM